MGRAVWLAFGGLAAAMLACEPQVVDALENPSCTNGSDAAACAGRGGDGGGGTSGGSGGDASGTGAAGTGAGGSGAAQAFWPPPKHRYSFDGAGTRTIVDSMGGEPAQLVGPVLDGSGAVVLAGRRSDQYVDLPNHIIAGLMSATFEAWVSWDGGDPWQRIFDFGEDVTGTDNSREDEPRDYFFLTTKTGGPQGELMRVGYLQPDSTEIFLDGTQAFPSDGSVHHVGVVVDTATRTLALYFDGLLQNSRNDFAQPLADIRAINSWLGRSMFIEDVDFGGKYFEFRIYDVALSASDLAASAAAGPDVLFPALSHTNAQ